MPLSRKILPHGKNKVLGNNYYVTNATLDGDTLQLTRTSPLSTLTVDLSSIGGGSPGGSNTQLQFNSGGAFGGMDDWTWDGTDLSVAGSSKLKFGDSLRYIAQSGDNLLIRNSETNGNIELNAKNDIKFFIDGAQKMHIDSNGNVGIRSTSPNYPLEVFQASGTTYGIYMENSVSRGLRFGDTSANGTGYGKIEGLGGSLFLGSTQVYTSLIGTGDANTTLGASNRRWSYFFGRYGQFGYGSGISENSGAGGYVLGVSGNADRHPFMVKAYGNNATPTLIVTSGSKVGIGLDTPTSKLHIKGELDIQSGNQTILMGGANSSTARNDNTLKLARVGLAHYDNDEEPVGMMYAYSNGTDNGLIIGAGTSNMNSPTKIQFTTAANDTTTAGTTRMTITSGGFVGIGTTEPIRYLDINSAGTDITARFKSTDNRGSINIADDDTSRFVIAENNAISLGSNSALHNDNLNVVNSDVGIGTKDPTSKLTISGGAGDKLFNIISGTNSVLAVSGNTVGIGTDDPLSTRVLHVVGRSYFNGDIIAESYVQIDKDGTPGLLWGESGDADLYYDGTNAILNPRRMGSGSLYVKGDMVVGSGASSYLDKLHIGDETKGVYGYNNRLDFYITNQPRLHIDASTLYSSVSTGAPSIDLTPGPAGTALYGFYGDTDTGMSRGAADTLHFLTAGVSGMTMDSSQNVGIGELSPAEKLQVKGNIRIDDGTNDNRLIFNNHSTVFTSDSNDSSMQMRSYGGSSYNYPIKWVGASGASNYHHISFHDDFVMISGNKMGIGTTSPSHHLHVVGNGMFTGGVTVGDSSADTFTTRGHTHLATLGNNVGIGTTGPNAKLEVRSTSNPQIRTSYNDTNYLDIYASNGTGYIKSDGRFRVSSSFARYFFYGNGSSTGRAEMFVTAGGDVSNKRLSSFLYLLRGYQGADGAGIYFGNTVSGSNNEGSTGNSGREGTQWYAGLNYAGGGATDEWILGTDYRTTSGSGADGYTPVLTAQKSDTYGQQGRIGINNKNPAGTFDIRQQTGGVHGLIVDTDYSNGDQIRVLKDGNTSLLGKVTFDGTNMVVGAWGSGGGIRFWNNGEGMRLTGDKLIIGGTVPGETLHVQGTSRVTGKAAFGGSTLPTNNGISVVDTIQIQEKSVFPASTSGWGTVWVSGSVPNKLYFTDDAGGHHDLTAGGGGIGGSIANTQVAYGNGTDITGSANLVFDGTNLNPKDHIHIENDKYIKFFQNGGSTYHTSIGYNSSNELQLGGLYGVKIRTYSGGWGNRVTVLSDGKVGVGTDGPTTKLDVRGSTLFSGTTTVIGDITGSSNLNLGTGVELQGGGTSTFSNALNVGGPTANQNTYMKIMGSGAGYTAAGIKLLTYNGANRPGGIYSYNHPNTAGWYSGPIYGTSFKWGINYSGNLANTGSALEKVADDANNLLTIQTNGQVGIGTTGPSDKLDVQDGYIRVGYTGGGQFKFVPHSSANEFGIYDANNTAYRFYIDNAGDVGIGTQSPSAKLDVRGGLQTQAGSDVSIGTDGDGEQSLRLYSDSAGVSLNLRHYGNYAMAHWGNTHFQEYSDYKTWYRQGTNKKLMRLSSDGQLGIGTTSPAERLHVSGNITLSGSQSYYMIIGQYLRLQKDTTGVSNGLKVTDTGGNAQPVWTRGLMAGDSYSSTPAAGEVVLYNNANAAGNAAGKLSFSSRDSGGTYTQYGLISGSIADPANTSEDGKITVSTLVGGTRTDTLTVASGNVALAGNLMFPDSNNTISAFSSDNLYIRAHNDMYFNIDTPNDSADRHFIWRTNTSSELMRLGEDGIFEVKDKVGINLAAPGSRLHVSGGTSYNNTEGIRLGSASVYSSIYLNNSSGGIEIDSPHTLILDANRHMEFHAGGTTREHRYMYATTQYGFMTTTAANSYWTIGNKSAASAGLLLSGASGGITLKPSDGNINLQGSAGVDNELIVTGSTLAVQKTMKNDIAGTHTISDSYSHYMATADNQGTATCTITCPASPSIGDEYFIVAQCIYASALPSNALVQITPNTGQTINQSVNAGSNIALHQVSSGTGAGGQPLVSYKTAHLICVDSGQWVLTVSDVGPTS